MLKCVVGYFVGNFIINAVPNFILNLINSYSIGPGKTVLVAACVFQKVLDLSSRALV